MTATLPACPRDIPIIFSGPMVRALLDGRKTMTRRLAWNEKGKADYCGLCNGAGYELASDSGAICSKCRGAGTTARPSHWQRVKPGDRLWVRESFHFGGNGPHYAEEFDGTVRVHFTPSIYMPRKYSRLTLTVTATKIERLQDISEEDARADGVEPVSAGQDANGPIKTHRTGFVYIWRDLHGPESWADNPDVVAMTFDVVKANIDSIPEHAPPKE